MLDNNSTNNLALFLHKLLKQRFDHAISAGRVANVKYAKFQKIQLCNDTDVILIKSTGTR